MLFFKHKSPLLILTAVTSLNLQAEERQVQTMHGASALEYHYSGTYDPKDKADVSEKHKAAARAEAINACSLQLLGLSAPNTKVLNQIAQNSDDYFKDRLVKSATISSLKVSKNEVTEKNNGNIIVAVKISCEGSFSYIDVPENSTNNADKKAKKLAQCLRNLAQEPRQQWQKQNYLQRFTSVLRLAQDRENLTMALQKCEQYQTIPKFKELSRKLVYGHALNDLKADTKLKASEQELRIVSKLNDGRFSCSMHSFFVKAGLVATVGMRVGSLYCYLLDGEQIIGASLGIEGGLGIGAAIGHEWKIVNRIDARKNEVINIKENNAYNDHSLNSSQEEFSRAHAATSGSDNKMLMTSLGIFNIFSNDGPASWGLGVGLGLFYTAEADANLALMPIGTDWDYLIDLMFPWASN